MAAADMYVTVAGAGTKAGNNWANAMDLAAWETDFEGSAEAGDRYFVKEGTYTLTDHFATEQDGTGTDLIEIIGVVSGTTAEPPTSADWATGDNRPLIAAGAYAWNCDDYWLVRNIRLTSTANFGLRGDDGLVVINCKATQTNGGARYGITGYGHYHRCIDCEASASGSGIAFGAGGLNVHGGTYHGCYAHDSGVGFELSRYTCLVCSIADSCTTGVSILEYLSVLTNNTFYNGTTGISSAAGRWGFLIYNNIFDSWTTGISLANAYEVNILDYNNYNNNGTDVTNVTKGPNAIAVDPLFANAGGGDFSPRNWANMLCFPGEFPGGLSDGSGLICGAVQPRRAVKVIGGGLVG